VFGVSFRVGEKLTPMDLTVTPSFSKKRKMLTQEFRTYIHRVQMMYSQDEEEAAEDAAIQVRLCRALTLLMEVLVKDGFEARYTGQRAPRHLRTDLRASFEQEGLTVFAIMFFSDRGVLRDDLDEILEEYRRCVADPVGYVAPDEVV